MTGRERVHRALTWERPDRPPRDLWALPGTLQMRPQEHQAVLERFPSDFTPTALRYGASSRAKPLEGLTGAYTDMWGSEWAVGEPGVIGEVVRPILADWGDLDGFAPPWELLEGATTDHMAQLYADTDGFVKAGTLIRPFEQAQFLRGSENLFMDLADGTPQLERLIRMVHEFYLRDLDLVLQGPADGVTFMDDWGSQQGLLISPNLWRELFKPLYRAYCERIHAAGRFVFFHSDGNIEAIYPDLIEIGVDALNSQLFCMDIEALGERHAGKITFWGEIDRQFVLPFGARDDVQAAVHRVRTALDNGRGGVIAQCEFGIHDPRENIETVFETWNMSHPDPARRYAGELDGSRPAESIGG